MFIKIIQLVSESQTRFTLNEVVINKRYVTYFCDSTEEVKQYKKKLPDGINEQQKYTKLWFDNEKSMIIVGDLDHIYKMFETDSMLNRKQTLKG